MLRLLGRIGLTILTGAASLALTAHGARAQCPVASQWDVYIADWGTSSIWTIQADGTATEQGMGHAWGRIHINSLTQPGASPTIYLDFQTADGGRGFYDVRLDPDCARGSGLLSISVPRII